MDMEFKGVELKSAIRNSKNQYASVGSRVNIFINGGSISGTIEMIMYPGVVKFANTGTTISVDQIVDFEFMEG